MKTLYFSILLTCMMGNAFCQEEEKKTQELIAQDIPLLDLKEGDWVQYEVNIKLPEGVQGKDAKAVDQTFKRLRTFIGKVKPDEKHPEVSCFEVTAPGAPIEREFVEIEKDKVFMRGSAVVASGKQEPLWLDPAVLLVRAGLKGGEMLPPIEIKDPRSGAVVKRNIQIIAREEIEVLGGKFPSIRILMTGTDGMLQLRRTIWFTPNKGILKEEKARYIDDKLVLKEIQTACATGDKSNSPK